MKTSICSYKIFKNKSSYFDQEQLKYPIFFSDLKNQQLSRIDYIERKLNSATYYPILSDQEMAKLKENE